MLLIQYNKNVSEFARKKGSKDKKKRKTRSTKTAKNVVATGDKSAKSTKKVVYQTKDSGIQKLERASRSVSNLGRGINSLTGVSREARSWKKMLQKAKPDRLRDAQRITGIGGSLVGSARGIRDLRLGKSALISTIRSTDKQSGQVKTLYNYATRYI